MYDPIAQSNKEIGAIIRKAIDNTMLTSNSEGALLAPEYGEKFLLELIDEDETFFTKCYLAVRNAPKGKITILGIADRNLRKKEEDEEAEDGYAPSFREIPYLVEEIGCKIEFSKKVAFRDNIEKKGFLDTLKGLIQKRIKEDLIDLAFNGDENIATSDPYYDFLSINNGWIKQIRSKSHIVDGIAINNGNFTDDYFFSLRKAVPKRCRSEKHCWICSDTTKLNYLQFLRRNRNTSLGDTIILESGKNITALGVPFEVLNCIPDDVIIYADPKNLGLVVTCDIQMNYTDVGKELVGKDHAMIATFLNYDPIIVRPEAISVLINAGDLAG